MLKAFRYLKPFWLSVVAVVALVFGQVQLELALPDYMSNIVTYGIQYNGITENIPEAMSQKTMDHLAYFMSDQDYKTVQQAYQLSHPCRHSRKHSRPSDLSLAIASYPIKPASGRNAHPLAENLLR